MLLLPVQNQGAQNEFYEFEGEGAEKELALGDVGTDFDLFDVIGSGKVERCEDYYYFLGRDKTAEPQ